MSGLSLEELCAKGRAAIPILQSASGDVRDRAVRAMADALPENAQEILAANALDLESAAQNGVPPQMRDRLALTEERLRGIADAMRQVAALPDPLGTGEEWVRPNGLRIRRCAVPLGLVAIIYEARPNVTADAAALCVKSGNCALLRGGKEAFRTNRAIVDCLRRAVQTAGLPADCVAGRT